MQHVSYFVVVAVVIAMGPMSTVLAQDSATPPPIVVEPPPVAETLEGDQGDIPAEPVDIILNEFYFKDLSDPSARVITRSVADDGICNVIQYSNRYVLFHGKSIGVTDVALWMQDSEPKLYRVYVKPNVAQLRESIKELYRVENFELAMGKPFGSLIISGKVFCPDRSALIAFIERNGVPAKDIDARKLQCCHTYNPSLKTLSNCHVHLSPSIGH